MTNKEIVEVAPPEAGDPSNEWVWKAAPPVRLICYSRTGPRSFLLQSRVSEDGTDRTG